MAYDNGHSLPKNVKVSDDQSYEHQKLNATLMRTKYFWFGQKWEDFARSMAAKGCEQQHMNFFIGASLNDKEITMRNGFGYDLWMDKYAERFPDFTFKFSGRKGVKIPRGGQHDEMTLFVNSQSLSEVWNDWVPFMEMAA